MRPALEPSASDEPLSSSSLPLPLPQVLAIGREVALALASLHRQGRVHGAVQPNNLRWRSDTPRSLRLLDDAAAGRRDEADASRWRYAAPEQTGRVDLAVDARSDLYALGVVLYELLTGAPPFRADDAMEIIHAHIARAPVAPVDIAPQIPRAVSDLVSKLLAKAPDERYQSAEALADDLTLCAQRWTERGCIDAFELGARDSARRLSIVPRLYGREAEAAVVRAAVEQARARASMLLVGGYAGSGKTALVEQLCRPMVRDSGYFVSGKFDQVARGVPFGALIQAFRSLVQRLLTESEASLEARRASLLHAFGDHGGPVLAEVMPEIRFVIGPQPPPVPLGPTEALNRFQRVLQRFVAALARPEQPLVLFLDDLQWADAATLKLVPSLLEPGAEIRGLLLVGAYRDNELDAAHGLMRLLRELESSDVALRSLELGPLGLDSVTELVADALQLGIGQAEPLARLCFDKTRGNPFFVGQFLRTLEREGHLRFDVERGQWAYRIDAIAQAPLDDNVVDMVARRIQRMPAQTRHALRLAACIGSRFELELLASISERDAQRVRTDLEPAVDEGLVSALDDHAGHNGRADRADRADRPSPAAGASTRAYAFVHDRVQQAAYAAPAGDGKAARQLAALHLAIGRLRLARADPDRLEHELFDVVHHLNLGRALIASPAERLQLAQLNARAARKAKTSAAFDAALECSRAGLELLGGASDAAPLRFELGLEAAECAYLCGDFDAAQRSLDACEADAADVIDRARICRLRSLQFENQSRYAEALASSRAGLALLDLRLPEAADDKRAALDREIDAIDSLLAGRTVAGLVDLPATRDPKVLMAMSMLTDIWATTFILGDPTLARLISATMVRWSLEYGNAPESAYGYVTHAITVGPVRGDYARAHDFGKLALAVNERFDDTRRRAKIYQQFHAHVNFWRRPMATCIPYAREACRSGLESGDFLYAAYGAATETWSAIIATQNLPRFVRDYEPTVAFVEKLKNRGFADSVKIILAWARALQGRTRGEQSLSDDTVDEASYLHTYADNPFFRTFHAVARLHLACLLGTPAQMLDAARLSGDCSSHVPGTVWPLLHDFWNAVALAANIDGLDDALRQARCRDIAAARDRFVVLARHCPENFQAQALLLSGLVEHTEGRAQAALAMAEQALEFTAGPGQIQQRALAAEWCARWRLERGERYLAAMFLERARDDYARWGAAAKAAQLDEQRHDASNAAAHDVKPGTGVVVAAHPPIDTVPAGHDGRLDVASVIKAAQAIAAEIELPSLLSRLLLIAVENAGAQRGCLVIDRDGQPTVYAFDEAGGDGAPLAPGAPLAAAGERLPLGIVNVVRRTGTSLVLDDAPTDERHGTDPYVARHAPRSVMAVAILRQGAPVGVLYLENRMLAGVFTAQRLRVMQVIAAQAAIALENARLVAQLEAENVYLRSELIANVSHDLRTPLAAMRGYLERLHTKGDALPADTRASHVAVALRQCEHMATLTDELFELAKLDFKGVQLELEDFALAELVHDVVHKFELAADRGRVTLRVQAPHDGLPALRADLTLIERVLDNLIANALRHTPEGGTIELRIGDEGTNLRLDVTDTGGGIGAADVPHVFDRYHRDRGSSGAGLGLAIVKRIVELHGGSIGVRSGPGGTCFSLRLPVQPAPERLSG